MHSEEDGDNGTGRALGSTGVSSIASGHLQRLESRIREFHEMLAGLNAPAAGQVDPETPTLADASGPDAPDLDSGGLGAPADLDSGGLGAPADRDSGGRGAPADPALAPPRPRRIDSLLPHAATLDRDTNGAEHVERGALFSLTAADARGQAEEIRREAERDAAVIRAQAVSDAQVIAEEALRDRSQVERDMQQLWQSLDREVRAIQDEVSERVDRLAANVGQVGLEAERIRGKAAEEADRLRAEGIETADRVVAAAHHESERIIAAARSAATTMHVRAVAHPQREAQAVDGDGSFRDVLDGLSAAVSLIERSLEGLAGMVDDAVGHRNGRGSLPRQHG